MNTRADSVPSAAPPFAFPASCRSDASPLELALLFAIFSFLPCLSELVGLRLLERDPDEREELDVREEEEVDEELPELLDLSDFDSERAMLEAEAWGP